MIVNFTSGGIFFLSPPDGQVINGRSTNIPLSESSYTDWWLMWTTERIWGGKGNVIGSGDKIAAPLKPKDAIFSTNKISLSSKNNTGEWIFENDLFYGNFSFSKL